MICCEEGVQMLHNIALAKHPLYNMKCVKDLITQAPCKHNKIHNLLWQQGLSIIRQYTCV